MIDKIEVSSDGGRTWVEMSESILTCALRCEHPFNWLVKTVNHEGLRYFCPLQAIRRMGVKRWKQEAEWMYHRTLSPSVSPFVELEPVGESPLEKLVGTLCGLPVYVTDKLPTIFGSETVVLEPMRSPEPLEIEVEPETWRDRPPMS